MCCERSDTVADVTMIPACVKSREITRTAAYARVSSDSKDQLNSFTAQIKYYTELLQNSQDSVLVDIYADEGISGTYDRNRDEFLRLMHDCRKGKIDRILTKSISRFARNTKDCLEAVRELKRLGISIYFEKENIDTAEISSEMLLTLYSTISQEESMSISGNCRMGIMKRMSDASYVPNAVPYGYRKIDGRFVIHEQEADIVRRIFNDYLNGIGLTELTEKLNSEKIPKGDNSKWTYRSISYILSNEKYLGDSRYHKWYNTDELPFRSRENHGEREMIYAFDTHDGIIEKDVFDSVQKILKKRGAFNIGKATDNSSLRKKIFCNNCGVTFKRRNLRGTLRWVCRNHDISADRCCIHPIPETEICNAFIRLQNKLSANCEHILVPMLKQLRELSDKNTSGNIHITGIRKEIAAVKEQLHLMSDLKLQGILDTAYFTAHSGQLERKLMILQNELHSLLCDDEDDETISGIKLLTSIFERSEPIKEFDDILFGQIVEKKTVISDTELRFVLSGGVEFAEQIQRKGR